MPESRPLGQIRFGTYDEPPASTENSPYPNRHSRLRRALQTTNDLAPDAARRSRTGNGSAGSTPPPRLYFTNGRRARRRMGDGPEDVRDGGDGFEESESGSRMPGPRANKRRKLNDDSAPAVKKPIKYGYYGQVEPGRLKLEIISNDGGEHVDRKHPEIHLGASNVLKMDKSVYCSERKTASIMMRHADNTPFCLEKLHIVGPEHGFTAPVREGLVYVAMNINDLQKYLDPPYHARRAGVHEPPFRHPPAPTIRRSPERLTLSDALRDPEISAAARPASPAHVHRYAWETASEEDDYYGSDFGFGRTEAEAHCEIPDSTDDPNPSNPNNPHITLSSSSTSSLDREPSSAPIPITLLTDDEAGPEEPSTQDILDYRLQRLRSMRRRQELDSWDRDDRWSGISNLHSDLTDIEHERERERADSPWALNRLEALMRPRGPRAPITRGPASPPPPIMHPPPGTSPMPSAPTETAPLDHGISDPNVQVARFVIQKGKYKVAIRFDPPVSGRYLLVKLWGGERRSNVDVQSVVAKGYGGQRFFPAVQLL